MRITVVAIMVASCLSTRPAAADFSVVDGNQQATIVVAAEANEKVRLAAEELQTYIDKMTGVELSIVPDTTDPRGALILVGRSRFTDEMKVAIPSGVTNARREEGFVIVCQGDRLVLAGNDEGPFPEKIEDQHYHGTEYAVYEFLNRLGVRWFMPGEFGEIVPRRATVTFPETQVRDQPDFIMRNWSADISSEYPELREQQRRWKIRNKMNPHCMMFDGPGDGTVREILPADEYFEKHPEYFAMNADGSRNPELPNLTHPQVVEIAAGIIKDYFRDHPDANSYGFAPADGFPVDYTPETAKLNLALPDMSGRYEGGGLSITEEWLAFANNVTAAVRQELPDVYIATNGYANRDAPPQGIELDDHLVIMFAAIWSCPLHGYDDEHCWQKVRQGQMLKRWCELSDNVWIFGYNQQLFVSGLTPLPEFTKLRRDFPLMKEWGVIGFWSQARNVWAEVGIASRYLRARLEWDANADVDAILDDFFDKWYGKAGDAMARFYHALDEAIAQSPMHGIQDRVLPEIYTPALMRALDRHIRTAERLAGTERTRLHVRVDRLIYEHLKAYVAMSAADLAGDYARAAHQAAQMLELRGQLHAINEFFIWPHEDCYVTATCEWRIIDRQKYYESLASNISGEAGELVALCPTTALFRTDPHDEGRFAGWHEPGFSKKGWKSILTTRPFHVQGWMDEQGHPYTGTVWYNLTVDVPASAADSQVVLYVPTLNMEGWCWVNGRLVGHRPHIEAAYLRPADMACDITSALMPGQANEIVFRINTGTEVQVAEALYSRIFLYSPKNSELPAPGSTWWRHVLLREWRH